MSKLLQLFTLINAVSFIYAYSVSDTCRWNDPQTGDLYDISSLNKPNGWTVSDTNIQKEGNLFNIDFIFNFCKPLSTVCNGRSNLAAFEALEVLGQVTDACEVLGDLSQMDVAVGTSMGLPGLRITYRGGETCVGSENPLQNGQPMSATFNVICSERKDDKFQQVTFNGNTITKCSPEFFIYHSAGCVGGAFAGGSSYLKILLIAMIVYVVGGFAYNIKFNNKKGLDAFPHIDFWRKVDACFGSIKAGGSLGGIFGKLKGIHLPFGDWIGQIVQKFKRGGSAGSSASTGGLTGGRKSAQYTLV